MESSYHYQLKISVPLKFILNHCNIRQMDDSLQSVEMEKYVRDNSYACIT
jgi:hypothetical protein